MLVRGGPEQRSRKTGEWWRRRRRRLPRAPGLNSVDRQIDSLLYYTIPHYTTLYYTILYYTILWRSGFGPSRGSAQVKWGAVEDANEKRKPHLLIMVILSLLIMVIIVVIVIIVIIVVIVMMVTIVIIVGNVSHTRDDHRCQSDISEGIGRQGIGSSVRNSHVSTRPCRRLPLLVHF